MLVYLKKPFWLSLTALARFNSKWLFVFLSYFYFENVSIFIPLPVPPPTFCVSPACVWVKMWECFFFIQTSLCSCSPISWNYKFLCWLTFKDNLEIHIWPRNEYLEAAKQNTLRQNYYQLKNYRIIRCFSSKEFRLLLAMLSQVKFST